MRISDWSSDVFRSADDKSVRRIGLDALTHGLHDLQIDAQQVIAAHARLAGNPGCNNDDVRASDIGIIVRTLQVRIATLHRAALGDMKLAVIAPGRPATTERKAPELETGEMGAERERTARNYST